MSKKAEIKKIEIAFDGKTISLTPAQAKELKVVLDELYGVEVVREEHHHYDRYPSSPYPYWRWDYPIYTTSDGSILNLKADNTLTCSLGGV